MIPKRISGPALRTLAAFARTRAGAFAVQRALLAQLAIDKLDGLPDSYRAPMEISNRVIAGRPPRQLDQTYAEGKRRNWAPGIRDIRALYMRKEMSPRILVERALGLARDLQVRGAGPLCEIREQDTLREADRSTERLREGRALSDLDGVPFVVKEQIAVQGFSRRLGTSFMPLEACAADATVVSRLRALGAIPIGLSAMTEYGMTPSGINAHRQMPNNPHNLGRIAGGSSTGSGVAVATGLVPFALGADGGGSIRIPAAMNGVFGIKPTWGRVSRDGDPSMGSVAHVGPLASSTYDLARSLEVISGFDRSDAETEHTPTPPVFTDALGASVRGTVVGVPRREWQDANADVARAGELALAELEKRGVILRDVDIPLAQYAPAIGYVTIALEARSGLREVWRDHADDLTHDLQVSFAALDAFSALEYADTQALRGGLRRQVASIFQTVDTLAMPGMQRSASPVSKAEMKSGLIDSEMLDGLCRFMFLGNLTGLPALVAPIGKDADGLPLAIQFVGDAWDESTLFALSATLEREEIARAERPEVAIDLLG